MWRMKEKLRNMKVRGKNVNDFLILITEGEKGINGREKIPKSIMVGTGFIYRNLYAFSCKI